MDTEPEELRFLNIFGILRESFKVLLSHTKLFIALTLTLILPLCVVGLGHSLITEPIARRIRAIDEDLHKELIKFYTIFALYLFFLLAFSLLSTSAIVYSVACIYSDKITSYKTVLSVVPRVWKRLIVTFLWALLMIFSYGILILIVAVVCIVLFSGSLTAIIVAFSVIVLVFLLGSIYINCVWHLGSVITVLEESFGLDAMKKSLKLIKGKQMVAFFLFFLYFAVTFLVGLGFGFGVVHGDYYFNGVGRGWRALLGCALILLLSLVDLMGFLVQTVFYFACKAHHPESIDRLQLSEHLGAYLGEYAPLRGSIQLEAF